jgi:hypothetical protein
MGMARKIERSYNDTYIFDGEGRFIIAGEEGEGESTGTK